MHLIEKLNTSETSAFKKIRRIREEDHEASQIHETSQKLVQLAMPSASARHNQILWLDAVSPVCNKPTAAVANNNKNDNNNPEAPTPCCSNRSILACADVEFLIENAFSNDVGTSPDVYAYFLRRLLDAYRIDLAGASYLSLFHYAHIVEAMEMGKDFMKKMSEKKVDSAADQHLDILEHLAEFFVQVGSPASVLFGEAVLGDLVERFLSCGEAPADQMEIEQFLERFSKVYFIFLARFKKAYFVALSLTL